LITIWSENNQNLSVFGDNWLTNLFKGNITENNHFETFDSTDLDNYEIIDNIVIDGVLDKIKNTKDQ